MTRNFRVSRGGRLLLDGNPKGCDVAEHVATKVEVFPRMLSALKNSKIHMKHEPRGNFLVINGWTSGNFSFLGRERNRAGFFQVR